MQLELFNTLSRTKEKFVPLKEGEAGIYTCGPTVYNYAHVGNLRAYIFADVLRRVLEFNGYTVKQVINITDVGHLTSDQDEGEDKLEKGAKREGKSVAEIAKFYEDDFLNDLKLLNIEPANAYPKATQHIAEMIEIIKKLQEEGFTYTAGGNVYFDTTKFADYGKMAKINLDPEALKSRVETDINKRNPFDFVLWFTNYKYDSHEMLWDSPWGKGFPGWHIECSAMATKYFGEHFDIHTGGIDHIPVHHTNEIAQSEAAFGHKWVNYWLHNDFLIEKEGTKMAKSEGEFLRLQTIIDKGYSPLDYRFYLLTGHYRSKLQFSWEALDSARNSLNRAKGKISSFKNTDNSETDNRKSQEYLDEFTNAVNDDLNTTVALSIMWKTLDTDDLSDADKIDLMKKYDKVFGLDLLNIEKTEIPEEVIKMAEERLRARKDNNWAESDKIRDEILAKGFIIKDTQDGYEIVKK